MIYRGHTIEREKIDSQIRWVVYRDGSAVHTTPEGEDAALKWVDQYKKANRSK